MVSKEQIDRIEKMESYLNECAEATKELSTAIDRMEKLKGRMTELFDYYGSEDWYKDREADLPEDVAAGVLSEDLVYDEITDIRDAAFQMLELATDILKNRI